MGFFDGFLNQYIDRYTIQLFKKYMSYVVVAGILLLLNIYIFSFQIPNYFLQKEAIKDKEAVLIKMDQQKEIISKYSKAEVDKLYKAISLLVPNKEDYFSIISAVENLSSLTGLEVLSYSIVFSSSTNEKIVLQVEAKGDIESLKRFLNDYRFKGGRLITMDKIEFSNKDFKSTLDLNFYTRVVALKADEDVKAIDDTTLSIFQEVSDTILKESEQTAEQGNLDDEYTPKTNPFGQ